MKIRRPSPEDLKRPLTKPVCFSCLLGVALRTIELSTADPELRFAAVRRVLEILHGRFDDMINSRPAWVATEMYWEIARITGNQDPYREIKRESNRIGLKMAEIVERDVMQRETLEEKVRRAVAAAITGNVIDYGTALHKFDPNELLGIYEGILKRGFAINDLQHLLEFMKRSRYVLYIADNAGETAFDRIFVKLLAGEGLDVCYAVRGGPISNDATEEDARSVGIDKYAKIISVGSRILGIDFRRVSKDFLEEYERCDFVIAKGQSNYETFTHFIGSLKKPVFLIFRVKCPPIAEHLGLSVGDNVVLRI